MFWNQQVEQLPRMDMIAWQNHKLNKVVERVYHKNLVYNTRMDKLALQPDHIKNIEDLGKLPFMDRQDIVDNYPYGLLVMPVSGVSYIHQMLDGSKLPTAMSYTKKDMSMWAELMARMLVAGGVNITSVFQVVIHGDQYPGYLGVHDGACQVGATVVPADGDRVLQQIKLMQDFGVTGIFSTTEYLLEVARKMRQLGSCPQELPLQVVFCNMQPSKHDSVRDVQKEYGVPVIEIYGLGDVFGMGVGAECHAKDGLHIQEDCFYPEIIESASGQVLPNGQIGELVLTSLTLEAMPLIRYRTGIRGFLDYSQCSCGRTLVRLKK